MLKIVVMNGLEKSRRGSVEIEDDVKFLLKKKVDFIRVGKKITFTNDKGVDVIWKYENQ